MKAGTPGFQAPEKLRAEHIGVHRDVYAVGAVLVELFGEVVLWSVLDPYQIMCKVVSRNRHLIAVISLLQFARFAKHVSPSTLHGMQVGTF